MHKPKATYLIKVCGNKYADNSLKVAQSQPDMMGWIFSPNSPRCCQSIEEIDRQIATIKAKYHNIRHVAVFAGNLLEEIENITNYNCFDLIQIAGNPAFIASTRQRLGKKKGQKKIAILPAIRVKNKIINNSLDAYGETPLFVLDSFVPGQLGGTGKCLERQWIAAVTYPYLLAGGLNPKNVSEALQSCQAYGADASSGLEDDVPGYKNMDKVSAFIKAIRTLPL